MKPLERLRNLCQKMNGGERLTEDEQAFVRNMMTNLEHDIALLGKMLAANTAGQRAIGMPRLVR